MGESETFLLSAKQNLANSISVSFNIMNSRINQLEANLEEKISANIETAMKTHIEKEVGKRKKDENSIGIRNNVIIKNLAYDEREKENAEVTLNKVQTLFRDGLSIPNVKIKKVTRKNGNERYNEVVVVQLEDNEQEKDIFRNKRNLKNNRAYKKVYIDNGLPVETRMF
ncbi:unnamed protein product [Mytilus coruscus]|uniref:Uncharacterized protein n=1 Tax=Mytilus coruscus TaxID=42192 RepID=A0A6J8EBK7_MYTCO|nr:unnamed protein product [Mytilus coruscus]